MVKEFDFNKMVMNNDKIVVGDNQEMDIHQFLESMIKTLTEYVSQLSSDGKLENIEFSNDFFKYLSGLNLVLLTTDAMRRDVFEGIDDMKSRVAMFLSAMRTCFDVETTDMVIKDNGEDN